MSETQKLQHVSIVGLIPRRINCEHRPVYSFEVVFSAVQGNQPGRKVYQSHVWAYDADDAAIQVRRITTRYTHIHLEMVPTFDH